MRILIGVGFAVFLYSPLSAQDIPEVGPAIGQLAVDGYTDFQLGNGVRVYVSSSIGSDAYNGLYPERIPNTLNGPKQSIAAAYALIRNNSSDQLLLRRGDSWNVSTFVLSKNGLSAAYPLVIGSYGSISSPRPIINATGDGIAGSNLANVAVVGLELRGQVAGSGIGYGGSGQNLLVEDCKIVGFSDSIVMDGVLRTNTRIRRNVLLNPTNLENEAASTNIFMGHYDGLLIEGNVLDHSVQHMYQNQARHAHGMYIGEDNPWEGIIIRENIAHNGGFTNYNVRPGGLVENNLSIRGATGIASGISYQTTPSRVTIRRNVIVESRNDYIRTFNPLAGTETGRGIEVRRVEEADIYENIIANSTDGTGPVGFAANSDINFVRFHDNVIYNWAGGNNGADSIQLTGNPHERIEIFNNDIVQPLNAKMINLNGSVIQGPSIIPISGNRYLSGAVSWNWFSIYPNNIPFSQWTQQRQDNSEVLTNNPYPNANRGTIPGYLMSLGIKNATTANFMNLAAQQRRYARDARFTANSVNDYFRSVFGGQFQPVTCEADMNDDRQLNINDFSAFIQYFSLGNMRADVNHDNLLNVADFTAYLQIYARGCSF